MARFGLAAIAIALVAAPACAEDKPPIVARAELCLRSNVDRVVAVEPDVDAAANFLLTYSCAEQVSDAARYELNIMMVKQFGAMRTSLSQNPAGAKSQAPAPSPSVDPKTGDIVIPPQQSGAPPDFLAPMLQQMGNSAGQFTMMPVSLRELAGSLVLEARERLQIKQR